MGLYQLAANLGISGPKTLALVRKHAVQDDAAVLGFRLKRIRLENRFPVLVHAGVLEPADGGA